MTVKTDFPKVGAIVHMAWLPDQGLCLISKEFNEQIEEEDAFGFWLNSICQLMGDTRTASNLSKANAWPLGPPQ